MNKLRTLRFLFSFVLSFILLFSTSAEARREKVYNILFVGNSYTFYNDLPAMVQEIARRKSIRMDCDRLLEGGANLQGHFHDEKSDKLKERIKSRRYDAIILQDQSMMPAISPEETLDAVRKWASLLPKENEENSKVPKLILFQTWGRMHPEGFDTDMQDKLTACYQKAADLHGGVVAPVGEAWRLWLSDSQRAKEYPLHVADGSHPNLAGSYLAASIIYATIFNKEIKSLDRSFNISNKQVTIPSDLAKKLQSCARKAIKDSMSSAEK